VRSKLAEGIRLFRGKRDFNERPAPPCETPDRMRLVIVGDWGSGLPRARKVADAMGTVLEEGLAGGLAQHVIHLGDVYYSGWGHEYRRRMLPHWPVQPEEARAIGSWSLNGNHDMYAGGYGYYDVLLGDARFARQAQSSYFSLVNKHWKILGLDTSWEDAALCAPQPTWLARELEDPRRILLLSHHQLFSAYEGVSDALTTKVFPILEQRPIDAWFWGHEHRCMTYKPFANVGYGSCIGHGGVPVYQWHGEQDPYPSPGTYEYRAYLQKGLEHWALFGFAVLDFDGAKVAVHYIDENGYEHRTDRID
jgi:hypothetical protein